MTTGKTYRFQGLNQWVRVACAVVLLSAASSARAQLADSTDIPLTSIDNDGKSAVYATTPQELQLQDNYRPRENDYLFPKKPWRRFQVGFGAGANWITDNQDTQHQSTAHLNLLYRFTPVHGLRFNVSTVNYRLAPDAEGNKGKAPAFGVGFDYLANLTNFAGGYDPNRYVDISLVTGVGTRIAKKGYDLGKGIYPYGKLGMQMDVNITKNVGLYVEPYVGLTKKMEQVLGNTIPERWNLIYGVQGGMKATFEDTGDAFAKSDTIRRKLFFDSSVGWTTPTMGSDITTKSGIAYQVAVGKWMNPMLGFRVGVQGQSFFYSKDAVSLYGYPMTMRKEQVMLSARGELMVDLPNAFPHWRDVPGGHNFDLNILVGGEYGWIRKSHQPGDSNIPGFMNEYYGMTAAMQLLYRINNPGTYIFIEPRYLGAFYKNKYEADGKHVRDDVYGISVGTRIFITNPSFRPVPRIDDYRHWWMAMDLGGMKWQRSWIYTHGSKLGGINPSLSLSVGYDLARLASFRAQVNYQHLNLTTNGAWQKDNDPTWGWGVWDNKYNVMDLRLSYMMNLNNLLQGYRADRRYNLWWTVGPAFSYVFAEKNNWLQGKNHEGFPMDEPSYDYTPYESVKGKFTPGVATSLMSVLALNRKIDLTVEAMGQYNFIRGVNPGYRSRINSVKYGLSVGTRYHFVPGELKSGSLDASSWFFDASVGWTFPTLGKNAIQKSGIAYQAAIGKWLHPVLGFRINGSSQSFVYLIEPTTINGVNVTNNKEQVLLAGRGEFILNPMNFASGWRNKKDGHDFDLNLLAGAEYGWNRMSHLPGTGERGFRTDYAGLTAAAQVLYRINNPGTYIFLEPRVLNIHYKDPYYFRGSYKTHENLYTISVGTRVYLQEREVRRAAADSLVSHWWMQADLGGAKWQRSYSYRQNFNNKFHPAVNFSLGYDWKKLASFRATLAYQHLSLMDNPYSLTDRNNTWSSTWVLLDGKYNIMDIRLAYMLNINNLFQGYNRDRRYNFYWTAGPALTCIFYENDKLVKEQNLGNYPVNKPRSLDRRQGNVSPAFASTFMGAYSIADNIDLTMEALGQFNFIEGTNPGVKNILNNVKYGVTVGARYHLLPGQLKSPLGDNRRLFFDSSYGWNTPTVGGNILHRSGQSYQMAIGKWFHPVFGVRVGATGQSFHHYYGEGTTYTQGMNIAKEEVLLGGRAEAIFAPLNLFASWRNKEGGHDFDWNLSVGGELGWNRRSHVTGEDGVGGFRTKYTGFTAATQLLYRVNNGTYIFLEPRYLRTTFDTPKTKVEDHDNVYSLSIGTRVHLQAQDIRRSHDEFTPNLWMGINLGGMKWQRSMYVKQGGLGVNPSLAASVGYDWKKFATFRAQLNYQHLSYTNTSYYEGTTAEGAFDYGHGVWENNYNAMDVRLSYMLNVNNLFQGYRADRKFNLWWTAGPALTYIFYDKSSWVDGQNMSNNHLNNPSVKDGRQGKVSPAIATSLMTQLQVAPKWDITCEAMGQYNFIWGTNPGFRGRINNVKYDFSVGTRYHF